MTNSRASQAIAEEPRRGAGAGGAVLMVAASLSISSAAASPPVASPLPLRGGVGSASASVSVSDEQRVRQATQNVTLSYEDPRVNAQVELKGTIKAGKLELTGKEGAMAFEHHENAH